MNYHFNIDNYTGCLNVQWRGLLNLDTLKECFDHLKRELGSHQWYSQIWHIYPSARSELDFRQMETLSLWPNATAESGKIAFVSESPLHLGLCRMYLALVKAKSECCEVFENLDAAKQWLDTPSEDRSVKIL